MTMFLFFRDLGYGESIVLGFATAIGGGLLLYGMWKALKESPKNEATAPLQVCPCPQGIVKYGFTQSAFEEASEFVDTKKMSDVLLAKKAKEYLVQKAEPKIREVLNTNPDATLEQLKQYFSNTGIVIVGYEKVESVRKSKEGYVGWSE